MKSKNSYYQEYSRSVVLLKNPNTDEFMGTGFLIGDSNAEIPGNKVFRLVTNRHIAVHGDDVGVVSNLMINGTLKQTGKRFDDSPYDWAFHENTDIDVASRPFHLIIHPDINKNLVIPKGCIPTPEDVRFISDDEFISLDELDEGDEVIFMGFPIGLGADLPRFKPILRRGIISLKDKHMFYIDGFSFPGNSGSPVFLLRKYNGDESLGIRLVGIIQGHIPYREECRSIQTGKTRIVFEDNTGLSLAFSSEAIKETFRNVHRKTTSQVM